MPHNYEASQATAWPLLLYLHGMGDRGNDLNKLAQTNNIVPRMQKAMGESFQSPFVVVTPQFPGYDWQWNTDVLGTLIDEIVDTYKIDTDRIYVTGASIGGYGTWALALAFPNRFAAIVPLMGGGDVSGVSAINHVPVWTCHGTNDTVIPFCETEQMVEALKACGGNVRFTVYNDRGHDVSDIYDDPQFYPWLLQHQRVTRSA